jgi:spore coat polysaccharide biosynthesis protein SpsF
MTKPRVAAIIQARMGSTRLPGKVLLPLAGQPVLWHIVHRLRQCQMVDVVAIATSNQPGDDALVPFASGLDVPLIRGPEDNVLQRFVMAAQALDADVIVRVTGDSPFIDPSTVDLLVRTLVEQKADYCVGTSSAKTIHEGFDPVSRSGLERLLKDVGNDPIAREHVTAYFKQHPTFGRVATVILPPGYEIDGVRASVDTPDDLRFLETLYQRLGAAPGEIDLLQAVQLLRNEPGLKLINAHVRQKAVTAATQRLVIRCDGTPALGLGHVVRSLAIARALRDGLGVGVSFAMQNKEPGPSLVREAGFPVDLWDGQILEEIWLRDNLSIRHADALLLDIRTSLPAEHLATWRHKGLLVAVLDDGGDRRLAADLAFYPPVPQLQQLSWTGSDVIVYSGWDWIPLRHGFDNKLPTPVNLVPRVVVTMGGSDPNGLSLLTLAALAQLPGPLQVRLILGRAFSHDSALTTLLSDYPWPIEKYKNVSDMPEALAGTDLAIAAFGGTAYELAALGVPTVLLALTKDHAASASALHDAGMAISLGVATQVTDTMLAAAIGNLLANPAACQALRAACTRIDGRGAERIAHAIVDKICGRKHECQENHGHNGVTGKECTTHG